ncbi:MAG: hypothetical protein ACXVNR_13145, partial [Bacteroidia bacterium]
METKINTSTRIFKASLIGTLLFLSSCTKHKIDPETPPAVTGVIGIHLHTNIGVNEVDSGMLAMDENGRNIQLNIAQFYISGVVLKKTDGSAVSLG